MLLFESTVEHRKRIPPWYGNIHDGQCKHNKHGWEGDGKCLQEWSVQRAAREGYKGNRQGNQVVDVRGSQGEVVPAEVPSRGCT